jgi:transcriptional regulator GlxA family with amidase domain
MPLLAQTNISVAETCVRVGFVSPAHFTRVFRNATGMNPSEYRTNIGGSTMRGPAQEMR